MDYQEYLDKYVAYDFILAKRCWAALIDYILYFLILALYCFISGDVYLQGLKDDGNFAFNMNPGLIPTVIIWFFYFPTLESILGYTPGKGIFDIKVISEDRKEFPFVVSLKRHLLDPVDFAFFGLVGIISIKYSKQHKRLGDFWAKSLVVKDEYLTERQTG